MARIPDDEIQRLKSEISVERLVTSFGVELKRHGAELIGRCPFHDDKTPSLVVSPKTNLWHCLGKCNIGGSAIDWVMRTQGVSFRHAVELLKADHPSLAAGEAHVVKKGTTAKLESPVGADADDPQTLLSVVEFYHKTLKESPEALRYLESRGLTNAEMVGHFKLGFANRKLGLTLPDKNRKAGADLRGRLQRLGILRAESGHEHMNGSVVFPFFSLAGEVLGMYGRKITLGLREGTPLHLYLPGPHRGVFNEEALVVSKEIILCESIIDALTFWCAGFRNVTCSYGVNGFTDDHRAAFQKHGTRSVWIAYDRDEAGDAAAERLKEELDKLGITSHRVLFPKGMDANEYARKVVPAEQSLAVLLNKAEWWGAVKKRPAAKEKASAPEPTPQAPQPVAVPIVNEAPAPVIPMAAELDIEVVSVSAANDEIVMRHGDRRFRIRGLGKNLSHDLMKVNVLVSRQDEFHVDTLDLYADRQRAAFLKRAAEELGLKEDILRKDLGRVFLKLEELRDEQIRKTLEAAPQEVQMSEEDRNEALALLRDPKLLDRILDDFNQCGLVGEESNKLIGYMAVISRHLESPLAVVVQSSSAAGKSSLMDMVLAFVPEEERIQYSAMTGQSLFYMGEMNLKHKVLAIVEEEGASRASYALKLLQSEGVLTIASTGKDPATGKLVTQQYRVEGPVMMFLTTTAIDIDEELLNRCLVLSVNADREQTQAIHRLQREAQTLEGLMKRQERREIIRLHQNAQRLIKPIAVVNPYARELTFPDSLTRARRDHMKYLTLIRSIALLHQHQRPTRTATWRGKTLEYIEATPGDITIANRLVSEAMGRSLDELRPETRRLLLLIDEMATAQCQQLKVDRSDYRFSRRDVRHHTGWSATQVRIHMDRLQEMEYLLAHRGGRGQSFVYELVFERGDNTSKPQIPGLIDVYDSNLTDPEGQLAGSKRGQNGGVTEGWRSAETRMDTGSNGVFAPNHENSTSVEIDENPVVAAHRHNHAGVR
ncbi:CHC2 zinc finger domain-containing protein [Bryobacter aggregatus]|uniref:CHC2 zinc finger domain-containing protein n=1 Tax=Bryobacter aggregatus TaxID=360054 RepID=UPI0009B5AAED|nr:CHC2 zinc finger domain-containing protein [Bryobacter aggregatus]